MPNRIRKKKKAQFELQIFKFHREGRGFIPTEFKEVWLCDTLGISYTTLVEQPDWFIDRMLLWLEQKQKAEESKSKK